MRRVGITFAALFLVAAAGVAIGAPTPTTVIATLANRVKMLGSNPTLDTSSATKLKLGTATANAIDIGRAGITTNVIGTLQNNGSAVGGATGVGAAYAGATTATDNVCTLDATRGPVVEKYNAIANAATVAHSMQNTTAATSGVQRQYPPGLEWSGTYWDGSASQTSKGEVQFRPYDTTYGANYSGFSLLMNIAGAGLGEILRIASNGGNTTTLWGPAIFRLDANSGNTEISFTAGTMAFYVNAAVMDLTSSAVKMYKQPQWATAGDAQTTVGAAGGASALPATPSKYFKVQDSSGTVFVIPAYAP